MENNHSSSFSESAFDRIAVRSSDSNEVNYSGNIGGRNSKGPVSEPPEGYKRLKLCKRGYREATASKVCGLSFEGCPVWIWAIRLSDWSKIVITGSDEVRLRQGYLTTWTVVKERLEIVVERDIPTLQGVDMWFVSGSMEYLQYSATPLLTPRTCWLSSGGRRKPSCCEGWQWTSVSHSRVGGTTSSTGMFGFVGLPQIVVPADPIRRAIGHIVKYSERPVPCQVPFVGDHYTVADLLSVHKLDIPVVFSSGFSRTGWGYRTLVDSEIGQAYDLPSFVSWEARFVKDILPL